VKSKKAKKGRVNKTGLATELNDRIVAKSNSELATFLEDHAAKLSNREKLRRHVTGWQRWLAIYRVFGSAGVLFLDWLPCHWMSRDGNEAFEKRLKKLKLKRPWLREAVRKSFGEEDAERLFLVHSGTIS